MAPQRNNFREIHPERNDVVALGRYIFGLVPVLWIGCLVLLLSSCSVLTLWFLYYSSYTE